MPAAIDELERVVGGSYRPGDGLVRDRDGIRVRGSVGDHVRGASALLTAFELTGRLPYAMLAEELMQSRGATLRAATRGLVDLSCERGARALPARGAARRRRLPRRRGDRAPAPTIARDAARMLAAASARALAGTPSDGGRVRPRAARTGCRDVR